MGFTKRELVGLFDSLTELVSEDNRKEAEFLIQTFMDSFEKSYPYEMTIHTGKETVSFSACYVAAMPETVQQEIREEVSARLKEAGNYSPESVERAMDSRLCDLEELLDVEKYAGKLEAQHRKIQERSRGGRR